MLGKEVNVCTAKPFKILLHFDGKRRMRYSQIQRWAFTQNVRKRNSEISRNYQYAKMPLVTRSKGDHKIYFQVIAVFLGLPT